MALVKDPKIGLAISSVVLLASLYWLGDKVYFAARANEAEGEVTLTYTCRIGRRPSTCGDVVYRTADDRVVTASRLERVGPVGAKVALLYDPGNPEKAMPTGLKHWFAPVGVVGLLLVSVLVMARRLRASSRAPAPP